MKKLVDHIFKLHMWPFVSTKTLQRHNRIYNTLICLLENTSAYMRKNVK